MNLSILLMDQPQILRWLLIASSDDLNETRYYLRDQIDRLQLKSNQLDDEVISRSKNKRDK